MKKSNNLKNIKVIEIAIVFILLSFFLVSCGLSEEKTQEPGVSEGLNSHSPESESLSESVYTPEPTPDPNASYIALTFDDGPAYGKTERLLEILRQEDVKATFFLLGQNASAYPETVRKIFDDGHEIGNHSYDHRNLTGSSVSYEEIERQMDLTGGIIEELTGKAPVSFRPPFGSFNDDVKRAAKDRGMAIYHWSWESNPEDYNPGRDSKAIAEHVVENARNGHIVLLHDDKDHTIDSIPAMVKGLREKGFVFVTVSELISMGPDEEPIPGKVYEYYNTP